MAYRECRLTAFGVSSGRAPLAREDRVVELALPLAFDELVLDEERLAPHPELLEHARRGGVPSLEPPDDAVQADHGEAELEQQPRGLGRIAVAMVGGVEHEADLAHAVLAARPVQAAVPDHLAGRP